MQSYLDLLGLGLDLGLVLRRLVADVAGWNYSSQYLPKATVSLRRTVVGGHNGLLIVYRGGVWLHCGRCEGLVSGCWHHLLVCSPSGFACVLGLALLCRVGRSLHWRCRLLHWIGWLLYWVGGLLYRVGGLFGWGCLLSSNQ